MGLFSKNEKLSKLDLVNKIREKALIEADDLANCIISDKELFHNCLNENELKCMCFYFVMAIYDDILRKKFDRKEIFDIISVIIELTIDSENKFNIYLKVLEGLKIADNNLNRTTENKITDTLLTFIITNKDFIYQLTYFEEISCYKKLCDKVKNINLSSIDLNNYDLKTK